MSRKPFTLVLLCTLAAAGVAAQSGGAPASAPLSIQLYEFEKR